MSKASSLRGVSLACTCLLTSCIDADESSPSRVDRPRILAVLATPAEATPGAAVQYRALVASPAGPVTPGLSWSFCLSARPATENGAAAHACVATQERPVADGQVEVHASMPSDACMLFGSETPSGRAPHRADASGGYYQPVRVALGPDEVAIFRHRIRCALPNAPLASAREYAQRYVPNVAPRIARIRAFVAGLEHPLDALPRVDELTLRLELEPDSFESYLLYDAHDNALVDKPEVLSVSWFVSAGELRDFWTTNVGAQVDNRWRGPPEDAWLWLVARDDRGASTVETRALRFPPP